MHIKKGTIVEMPIYAAHLDTDFFSNPESFQPERFLEQSADNVMAYTYRPFGGENIKL